MKSSRRQFAKGCLQIIGTSTALSMIGGCVPGAMHKGPKLLSARTDAAGRHYVGAYSTDGSALIDIQVSERAHGLACNPINQAQCIFFARRPGSQLHLLDIMARDHLRSVESSAGRHFYGHGCFSADGNWLYTTENDYENGLGVIGVRNASTLELVEEYSSYGIGPHEVHMMPDQNILVVANGGILTHPSEPRKPLNISTMQPSLAYIDLDNGQLLGSYRLPYSQLGIRHIDISSEGRVAIATQIEAEAELPYGVQNLPLLATHRGEDQLQLFPAESYSWNRLRDYCGSVAFGKVKAHKDLGAITSPRGGRLAIFDFSSQQLVADFSALDVCGVSYSEEMNGFLASTGTGSIYLVDVSSPKPAMHKLVTKPGLHWDNHLVVI